MELEIIDYLASDSELRTLLSGTGNDTKIYPNQAPLTAAPPYVVYNTVHDGTLEENLLERSLNFNCVAETSNAANQIKDRINEKLDKQDKIRNFIFSTQYWFYWCQQTGGVTFKDPDINAYHSVATFDFKYSKFTIEDMQMLVKLLDELGNFINATNQLPIRLYETPEESIWEYDEIGPISSGDTWNTILTYTVSTKQLWLDQIIVTGDVDAEYSIWIDTENKAGFRTSEQDRTGQVPFKPAHNMPVGTIIDIKVRHANTSSSDFKASLIGHKYAD